MLVQISLFLKVFKKMTFYLYTLCVDILRANDLFCYSLHDCETPIYIPAILHSLFYFYFFSYFKDKISFFTFPKILMFCSLSTSSPGHRFTGDESVRYIRYIEYIIWHDPPIRKDINIFENSKRII